MGATIQSIMVATDFSANARQALEWAIALGRQHDARIMLVHAIEPAGADLDAIAGSRMEESRRLLCDAETSIEAANLRAASEIHPGRAWRVISEAAERHAADLIVMGTRGRTGYKRVLLGSTADRLIRTATAPVLVVHPTDALPKDRLRQILVAVDFSDESSLATSMAARLLGGTETGSDRQRLPELILLHTIELMIEWPTPDVPDLLPRHWDDEETAAKRRLESIAAGLRSDRLSVEARTLRGYAPEVIEEQVLTTKPDLVALGTRGQSGLAQLMVGSVTASVLQHVTCPVLTTRRAKAEDATQGQQ